MPGRTLFLDVDGVMNRIGYGGTDVFEYDLVSRVCSCVRSLSVEVVVHSSWREVPEKMDELRKVLGGFGVSVSDVTESGMNKAESVIRYVERHGIESYVVVDDNDYSLDFPGRFVRTLGPGRVGFMPEDEMLVKGVFGLGAG